MSNPKNETSRVSETRVHVVELGSEVIPTMPSASPCVDEQAPAPFVKNERSGTILQVPPPGQEQISLEKRHRLTRSFRAIAGPRRGGQVPLLVAILSLIALGAYLLYHLLGN